MTNEKLTINELLAKFAPDAVKKNQKARRSVQRLINSHFGNNDKAVTSIPVDIENDDDMVATLYVKNSLKYALLASQVKPLVEALGAAKDAFRKECLWHHELDCQKALQDAKQCLEAVE